LTFGFLDEERSAYPRTVNHNLTAVLEAMRVPRMDRVFVLRCFDRRVTIYA